MTYDYDLFVIGAGSGGVRAARVSSQYGAKVAIAEESRVGGTCVIRGCVPKKFFVYAGRYAESFTEAAGYGWSSQGVNFDWAAFKQRRDTEIARLERIYKDTLENNQVEIIADRAVVIGPNAVRLAHSNREISAQRILIATGGRPVRPDIPGAELALTSDDIFNLPAQPKSIAIIGGGFIALEFACALQQLGTQVTLIHRATVPLRGFDEDLQAAILASMEARGIALMMDEAVEGIVAEDAHKRLKLKYGADLIVDEVLFAAGRSPNTRGLGLEYAGVDLTADGAVRVDAQGQSSVSSIYAVGDVTNRVNLTPVAIREGHAFADSVFGDTPRQVDYECIPKAVFTTPEIGAVGLTEAEARAQNLDVKIYKTRFRPMAATLSGSPDRVLMKLVVEEGTERVLGAHIFAPEAAEMIQLVAIAVKMQATKADFDATIAVHPTMAEELVTLRG